MARLTTLLQQHIRGVSLEVALISFSGTLVFAGLLFLTHRIVGSDDTVFQELIKSHPTLFDWLHYRYFAWSGRIFPESFVYLLSSAPLIYWKIISFILYCIFLAVLFAYYHLLSPISQKMNDIAAAILIVLLPFLLNPSVFFQGGLWVTGSMNYFWIVIAGLVACYPAAHFIARRTLPPRFITIVAILCGVIACSQEQVGAVIVALLFCSIVLSAKKWPKQRQQLVYLGVTFFIYTLSFIVSVKAPGNEQRLIAETATWLPDFYSVPLLEHIDYGYRWVVDALIHNTGPLLLLFWTGFLALFVTRKNSSKLISYIMITMLAIAIGLTVVKHLDIAPYLFEFYPTWKTAIPPTHYIGLIIWTTLLIGTVFAPLVYYKNTYGIYYSLLIAAGIASTIVIAFSPTMYASGLRTLFVPSILFALALLPLVRELTKHRTRFVYATITAIVTVAGLQCIQVVVRHI